MRYTITVRAALAWWAIPAARVAHYALFPFVGTDRAADIALRIALRGLRISIE